MFTGLASSRRRERVLLGLDQAFAPSLATASSSRNTVAGTESVGAAAGQAGGTTASSNNALYAELPTQISTIDIRLRSDKTATPTTVEGALQDLLLRNTKDLQLKGKTVTLDNVRGQKEHQQKEVRLRRQLLRGRTRFSVRIVEEGGKTATTGIEGNKADNDNDDTLSNNRKRKRKRWVASPQDYVALEGAWQGYMQQLLGVHKEEKEEKKKQEDEGRETEDRDSNVNVGAVMASRSSSAKPAFSSKRSAERNVVGADMHGAPLRVVASKCPSEVGLEGLVLRESRGALHILPMSDGHRRVRIVPKAGRRFQATVGVGRNKAGGGGSAGGSEGKKELKLILHGNGLVGRGRAIASPLLIRRDKGGGGEAGRLLKTTEV